MTRTSASSVDESPSFWKLAALAVLGLSLLVTPAVVGAVADTLASPATEDLPATPDPTQADAADTPPMDVDDLSAWMPKTDVQQVPKVPSADEEHLPNLLATGIEVSLQDGVPHAVATFRNTGGSEAGPFTSTLLIQSARGEKLGEITLNHLGLPDDSEASLSFPLAPTYDADALILTVSIDSSKLVEEFDETDNVYKTTASPGELTDELVDAVALPSVPATTSMGAAPTSEASEVTVEKIQQYGTPWTETSPHRFGVVIENEGVDDQTVAVRAHMDRDNVTVASTQEAPLTLPSKSTRLVNMTLSAPAGPYDLVAEVFTLSDEAASLADLQTKPVEVSLPLDLPPTAYVRVVDQDGVARPATPEEVVTDDGEVTVTPSAEEPCCTIEVYREWLRHELGTVAASAEWTPQIRNDGTWVRVDLRETDDVTFERFTTDSGKAFTEGDDALVVLNDRPMWVEVLEERSTIEENVTLQGADGPVETTNVTLDPHLEISFEDEGDKGQTLTFNATWLREVGFENPVFHYPDGEVIPFDRVPEGFLVHAPHFSTIMVDDFECEKSDTICPDGLHGWDIVNPGKRFETVDMGSTPSSGDNVLWAWGASDGNHAEGNRDLTPIAPDDFSFWAYVDAPSSPPNWHQAILTSGGETAIKVGLVSDDASSFKVRASGSDGKFADTFSTEQWGQVQIQNIDWSNCVYDLRVRGVLLGTGLSMDAGCSPGSTNTIDKLWVRSKGWGAEPWYVDNIRYEYTPGSGEIVGDESFEDGLPSSWTATDDWRRSGCRSSDGSWSMRWSASTSCSDGLDPSENAGVLISEEFNVPTDGGILQFSTWWDTRTGDVDVKTIRLSVTAGDQDSRWREIGLITHRDVSIQTWEDVGIDLAPWAGSKVKVQWLFDPVDTGGSTSDEGWYVDNVRFPASPGNDAPSAILSASPTLGTSTTDFKFDASESFDLETPTSELEVRWDWNDNGWNTGWSTDKVKFRSFSKSGDHPVRIEVRDPQGLTDQDVVTVRVDNPPDACFDVDPNSGPLGTTFEFDATCTTDDLTAFSDLWFKWDWDGDGTWDTDKLTTPFASHEYETRGDKDPIVMAVDEVGNVGEYVGDVDVVNIRPTLTETFVTPGEGTEHSVYTFGVTYTDTENDPPQYVRVDIDGIDHAMTEVDSADTNYTDGKEYILDTELPEGPHDHRFETHDGFDFRASSTTNGPMVFEATAFGDNVENGVNGWTTSSDSLWHQAEHVNPASGITSWWFGDEFDGNYAGLSGSGTLTSPQLSLSDVDHAVLSFMSWRDMSSVDSATVEISVNGGSWQIIENREDIRDDNKWYPISHDISEHVGQSVQVRFNFQISSLSTGGAGWFVDDIAIGRDSDRDGLSDYVEERTRVLTQFSSTSDQLINRDVGDGTSATYGASTLPGLDYWNADKLDLTYTLDHPDWSDLEIELKPEHWHPCTVTWSGSEGVDTRTFPDIMATCGWEEDTFEMHQEWELNVTDASGREVGRILEFKLDVTGDLDKYDHDIDQDRSPDGLEINEGYSHPLSQDVDDDGFLDPHDLRPFIEDIAPQLAEIDPYDDFANEPDYGNGIQFYATDNRELPSGAVHVTAIYESGDPDHFDPEPDSNGLYAVDWDPTGLSSRTVEAFVINVTDARDNWIEKTVTLSGGKAIEAKAGVGVASIGFVAAAEAAVLYPEPVSTGLGLLVLAGFVVASYMAYTDSNGDRQTIRQEITTQANSFVGAANVANVGQLLLFSGSAVSGWQRVEQEALDRGVSYWSSAEDLLTWLEGRAAADVTKLWITEKVAEVIIRDASKVVSILIVGNVIADTDIFPTDIPLWGEEKITIDLLLQIYRALAAEAYGPDYWNDHPPVFVGPGEEEAKNCRRIDSISVKTINAEDSRRPRPEGTTISVDSCVVQAIWRVVELGNVINADAMNTGIAMLSLDYVRALARTDDEQPADWYWGPVPSSGCPEDRRRCDQLTDTFDLVGSDTQDFSKAGLTWPDAAKVDALSSAGTFADIEGDLIARCTPVETWRDGLAEAEAGHADISGTWDARMAGYVDVATAPADGTTCEARTVFLELASSSGNFQYS